MPLLEKSQPEIVILGPLGIGVAAGRNEYFAPEHHRGIRKGTVDETLGGDRLRRNDSVDPAFVALVASVGGGEVAVLQPLPDADERPTAGEVGMGLEKIALHPEPGGVGDIVGIHPGDEITGGRLPGEIGGPDEGTVPSMDADPFVLAGQPGQDRTGAIVRGVIDQHDLEVAEVLRLQACHGGRDRSLRVPGRHHHGDGERAHAEGRGENKKAPVGTGAFSKG